MIETKRAANGAGLAANQVGDTRRIAVVEVEPGNPRYPYKPPIPLTVIVNPVLEPVGDETVEINEGCLSVPDLRGTRRAPRHRARALPRPRRRRARRGAPRADRRDVPARGRPPRRRAVPRPRARPVDVHRPGSSSTATTARRSRRARGRWWSGSARDALWCELAWLGGERPEPGVLIEIEGDRIVASRRAPGAATPPRRTPSHACPGLTLPGPRQRPLARVPARAARAHARGHGLVLDLARADVRARRRARPRHLLRALARDVRRDGAGRHHLRRRVPLPPPRARRHALRRPERDGPRGARGGRRGAASGITLLDACYLHGGIDALPRRRRRAPGPSAWTRCAERPTARVGAAIHSVRAVDPASARDGRGVGGAGGRCTPTSPSSRRRTRSASRRTAARRPGCWPTPARCRERFTAVHATHLTDDDVALLGGAGVTACLCPTTERDLADGIGPARRLLDAGAALAIGSDSQAVIDPFEEARAIELDERLATGVRGVHRATDLLRAATAGGYARARLAGGRPDRGRRARRPHHRRARQRPPRRHPPGGGGRRPSSSPPRAADVRHVMVGGRWSVRDGEHVALDVAAELRGGARAMSALVVDDIGLLVTNDPALGEGPLGLVRDAALVIEDGRRDRGRARGRGGGRADRRRRALRDPGVRRLAHAPRVRGRPRRRVRGADGGRAVRGGRHPRDDRGDARRLRRRARRARARPPPRGAAGRHHAPRDQVRLRPRRRHRAARSCEVAAAAHRRRDVPRRPRRPGRVRGPRRRLRRARLRRDARRLRAARPLDRRLLRGRRLRRRRSRARCSRPAAPPGSGLRVHGNQLGPGPGRRGSRSSWARPPSTTAPT